jgi:hypothetical protein
MSIDFFEVIDWENCYLVFYSQNDDNIQEIYYHSKLYYNEPKDNTTTGFYSPKASRFGILVNPLATHWAVCLMDDFKNEILFDGVLPGNYEYITEEISDTKEIVLLRYNKYLKFTAGTKLSERSNKARHSRFKNVSD